MLREIYLKNFVLVESCRITFSKGFNIITGETGAGKTALLQALSLIAGQKAASNLIRRSAPKAIVEAIFDNCISPDIFEELGLEADQEEFLIIKREIDSEKKSKIFLNSRPIPLFALQKLASNLLEINGQYSQRQLFSSVFQRDLVDAYGHHKELVKQFSASFRQKKELEKKLEFLKSEKEDSEKKATFFREKIAEIEEVNPKLNEDEELFEAYQKIIHFDELNKTTHEAHHLLYEGEQSIMAQLQALFHQLSKYDQLLQSPAQNLSGAIEEIKEASFFLKSYGDSIEYSPKKREELESRLAEIERLKKSFNLTIEELHKHKQQLEDQVHKFSSVDDQIEDQEKKYQITCLECETLAKSLSEKRREAARELKLKLSAELNELNMKEANISILCESISMGESGTDQIQFLFKANPGERETPLSDSASGGEISRVYFAMQNIFAKGMSKRTFLFDEIDANIGGKTARMIGNKLKTFAKSHQVIAITHFPQVALSADKHFTVTKEKKENRTIGLIKELSQEEIGQEMQRMIGFIE